MITLDKHEEVALNEFLKILDEQRFDSQPTVRHERIRRGENGQIIVPVDVTGSDPSVSLSLFMQHKADQLYQHTACRFVLAQNPQTDPSHRTYVLHENSWYPIE